MEYTLLNNGVKMPMVGLGTFPLKGKPLQELIKQTFDLGYTLYDTAWLYKNERDISIGINQNNINRDELFLTSKYILMIFITHFILGFILDFAQNL